MEIDLFKRFWNLVTKLEGNSAIKINSARWMRHTCSLLEVASATMSTVVSGLAWIFMEALSITAIYKEKIRGENATIKELDMRASRGWTCHYIWEWHHRTQHILCDTFHKYLIKLPTNSYMWKYKICLWWLGQKTLIIFGLFWGVPLSEQSMITAFPRSNLRYKLSAEIIWVQLDSL